MNVEIHKKTVPVEIIVKAKAEVKREIEKELEIPDPDLAKAKAILGNTNENTAGYDGRTGS